VPSLHPLSRRQFLTGAGIAGIAAAGGIAIGHDPIERALGLGGTSRHVSAKAATPSPSTSSTSSTSTGNGVLVLVALYGGNDGLNTLIPYVDPAYHSGRPTIGYQPNDVIPLDAELALNPNLKGLKTLWDAKKLAIVRGVGHADPTFSHFREMDIWQSAVPETDEITGWIGRYLDQAGHDPLYAMSLGPTLPQVLQGAKSAGSSIPSGSLTLPHGQAFEAPFTAVESPYPSEPALAATIGQSGVDLLTVLHSVKDVLTTQAPVVEGTNLEGAPDTTPSTTTAPGAKATPAAASGLAGQLDLVARLIKGGLPTRVYVVSLGGFDTHGGERATQDRLLAELDGAVTGFVNAMVDHPVVLMTFSEFGRRVAENASGGTDHGSSAPLFVAGAPVKGGYYGEQPSLANLDDGNLQFTTDFRQVYATVAENVLGIDPKVMLEGQTFPTLPFL
jgi:uncharacterized protein (DUF1501 family)